ncbi:MAG: hypothetical protein K0S12_471 [Bacteroidetes bacterium]|jgi:hypothetical protein|nr:hypothetical protein [Bacteroidota bacterium]
MESTIKSSAPIYAQSTKAASLSAYDKFLEKLKFSYFGIISMTISIGSILGGIAAMCIFENDAPIWQLAIVMGISMANNVACIGQAPIKWVMNLFFATTVLNTLFIIVNSI